MVGYLWLSRFRGPGVDVFLLALRGKTENGYGSRSIKAADVTRCIDVTTHMKPTRIASSWFYYLF